MGFACVPQSQHRIRKKGVLHGAATRWVSHAVAVAQAQAPSATAGFSPGVSYEKRHVDYEVARDGRFVKTTDTVRLILNDSGVLVESRLRHAEPGA